jgi:hypothetical protein
MAGVNPQRGERKSEKAGEKQNFLGESMQVEAS